jgi:hypothetical protein
MSFPSIFSPGLLSLELRVELSMTGSAVPVGRSCAASIVAEQSKAAIILGQNIREMARRE